MYLIANGIRSVVRVIAIVLLSWSYTYGQGCSGLNFHPDVSVGCSPLLVKFTATGAPVGSKFDWDFGTGNISGKDTIYKAFTVAGKYDATLTVTLPSGIKCVISKNDIVEVLPSPVPDIQVLPSRKICDASAMVTFIDNTPNIVSREWVIDGQLFSEAPPSVQMQFSSKGAKSVSLKVTNSYGCTSIFTDNKYVELLDSFPVNFYANINVTKVRTTANFSTCLQIPPGRTVDSYTWDFPGGSPSSYSGQSPPPIIYNAPVGNNTVTLRVKMKDGCEYVVRRPGFIKKFISVPKDSVCINVPFGISNLTTGKEWQYRLLGSVPVAPTNPLFVFYPQQGYFDYEASYTFSGDCRNTITIKDYIYIKGPQAAFESPTRNQCNSLDTMYIFNKSITTNVPNVKYTWYVLDSTGKVILKQQKNDKGSIYFVPPTYAKFGVSLVAESTNGCKDSVRLDGYLITARPTADFEPDTTHYCVGQTVILNATTTPEASYTHKWLVQNIDVPNFSLNLAGGSASFPANTPGRYSIRLISSSDKNCADTITKYGVVTITGVKADIKVQTGIGCTYMTTRVSADVSSKYPPDHTNQLQYEWLIDPPDGAFALNPKSQVTDIYVIDPDCYDIYLNISDSKGCTTVIEKKKAICAGIQDVEFTLDPNKCLGQPSGIANFTPSDAEGFKWFVEPSADAYFTPSDTDRVPSIVYLKDTIYTVKMVAYKNIVGNLCTDTVTRVMDISLPEADFSSPDTFKSCTPQAVRFNAKANKIKEFHWYFGDGPPFITTNPSPTHVYQFNKEAGYDVMLIAFDSLDCSDTLIRKNYIKIIGPEPRLEVDKKVGCDSLQVLFKDVSKNVINYVMSYDDASEVDSNKVSPHTYNLQFANQDSIIFHPTMIVVDDPVCKSYYKDTISLFRTAIADFDAIIKGGCAPLTVQFANKSLHSTIWAWDLDGDGVIDDSSKHPLFTYEDSGHYTVTLLATNTGGCQSVMVKKWFIEVLPTPKPKFQMSQKAFCDRGVVDFKNESTLYSAFRVDYGDGSPKDSNQIRSHFYYFNPIVHKSDSAVFVPSLHAFNQYGCSEIYRDTIVVYANPIPGFVSYTRQGCAPFETTFEDTSKYSVFTEWDFNNDGIYEDQGKLVNHTFTQGYHTIRQRVWSRHGCVDTIVRANYINASFPPEADFHVSDTVICLYDTVKFYDASIASDSLVTWYWDFDDNLAPIGLSIKQNPSFSFHSVGRHDIMLVVQDRKGCLDTVIKRTVHVKDTVAFLGPDINYVTVESSNKLDISWRKSEAADFAEYRLIRKYPTETVIFSSTNVNDTFFSDEGGPIETGSKSLCYQLKVIDKCGTSSLPSNTHCNILLNADNSNGLQLIDLAWTPYNGFNYKSYRVYRSVNGGKFTEVALVLNETNWRDSTLCDEEYCYYVEATNHSTQHISRSNTVCMKPLYFKDANPEMRYVTVLDNKEIEVVWEPSIQPNHDKYILDRYDKNAGWLEEIAITEDTFHIDASAKVGRQNYHYRVRSVDDCGYLSKYSNLGSSIWLTHKIVDDKAVLQWTPYQWWKNGVGGYLIQIRDEQGRFKSVAQAYDTFYVDNNTYPIDTAYCYRIVAYEGITGEPDTSTSNTTCVVLKSRIHAPNAFTPFNKDTINSVWNISALSIYNAVGDELKDYKLEIFNRWGQLMFTTTNLKEGWDGTFKGEQAPEGVYGYTIKASGYDGRTLKHNGTIMLLK